MSSSSTSTGNTSAQTSAGGGGAEGNNSQAALNLVDQRKRKRMESNRESAKRSRMRKQKHLDELSGKVAQLKKENCQVLTSISVTAQKYARVEAENSVLRAQFIELTQRLHSLNEILEYTNSLQMNSSLNSGMCTAETTTASDDWFSDQLASAGGLFGDGLAMNINGGGGGLMGFGQSLQCPIVASADMFAYNY